MADCYAIVERARPRLRQDTLTCNHGGVLAAAPSGVRVTAIDLGLTLLTFEAVKVYVCPSLSVALLVY
jgi:hypothetical protein